MNIKWSRWTLIWERTSKLNKSRDGEEYQVLGNFIRPCLKAIFRYLRGFLSREDQVEELMRDEELKDYIKAGLC